MPIQMRLSETDSRRYSPDRDLAYCGPHLVNAALLGLEIGNQDKWIVDFLKNNNVQDEFLAAAGKTIAEYMNKALANPEYKTPFESLTAVGFFALPPEVQTIVCAKLGQALLCALFTCVRDVIRDPNEPYFDAKAIGAAAEKLIEQINLRNKPDEVKKLGILARVRERVLRIYSNLIK